MISIRVILAERRARKYLEGSAGAFPRGQNAGARLDQQFAFFERAGRLKSMLRATTLVDGSRREDSGEHSWHLALYALVLADQAAPGVDITRVIKMLLLHDLSRD